MIGEGLDHSYVARVELTHRTPLPVREHWEEVVQEPAVVGEVFPGPGCEKADNPFTSTTRFLHHLEEDLFPSHFNFTVDSDGNYLFPHSPVGIASSDQVQRQQQRDEPVRENTHLVLDTLASRLRELSLNCRS